jgi:hypothetical protein
MHTPLTNLLTREKESVGPTVISWFVAVVRGRRNERRGWEMH